METGRQDLGDRREARSSRGLFCELDRDYKGFWEQSVSRYGSMNKKYEDDAIEKTIAFWNKKVGVKFSREDAREMIVNVSGFFRILAAWDGKTPKRDKKT